MRFAGVNRDRRGEGRSDRCLSEVAAGVNAEVEASGALRLVAEVGERDEAAVLAGGCRDEDIVVGPTPVE